MSAGPVFSRAVAKGEIAGFLLRQTALTLTGGKTMLKKAAFLISIFVVTQIFAADVLIKAGANNSWFSKESETSETKMAYGVGLQFPTDESQKILIGVDALYVEEKMTLLNKIVPKNMAPIDECDNYSLDIILHYQYFHVPIYLNAVVFQRENFKASFLLGFGLKLRVGNSSYSENYRFDLETCDTDYRRTGRERDPMHPTEIIIGSGISYKRFGAELMYQHTLKKTESLAFVTIQDHIESIRLMLTWRLKKKPQKS